MSIDIFQEVRGSLQPRLLDVLQDILPGGRVQGKEYVCASLQGGHGTSCKTNLESGKGSDFSTGESWGDVIGLWARIRSLHQIEAAKSLADKYGIHLDEAPLFQQMVPATASGAFAIISPVPASAPEPPRSHSRHGQASGFWRYADRKGNTLAYVARFDLPDGAKEILPLCYGDSGNGPRWQWKTLPEPRPLYGLEKLAGRPDATILLVEGEKTADAAQALFPEHIVMTWSGGANAVGKADLSPLHSKKIIAWPDNDEPGFKAALTLARVLDGQARLSIVYTSAPLSVTMPLPVIWRVLRALYTPPLSPIASLPNVATGHLWGLARELPLPSNPHQEAKHDPQPLAEAARYARRENGV